MLDMGFLPAVRRIMRELTGPRQTMLFSATISGEIAKLAGQFMHDPVRIDLAPRKGPAVGVTQTIYAVDQSRKSDLLVELLKDNTIYSAIAFTRTKARADRLFAHLQKHSVTVERIHSNRSQAQRGRAIEDFKRGKYRVLVATDLAWHRYRRARARRELRRADGPRGLRSSRRPHRAREHDRQRDHVRRLG
jgi:ATP-dependent RNA helicase RhlE